MPDNFDEAAKENNFLTNEKLKDVFNTLGVESPIVNVKNPGKFDNSRSNSKTILVELLNQWKIEWIFPQKYRERNRTEERK